MKTLPVTLLNVTLSLLWIMVSAHDEVQTFPKIVT
jgi:hypothetical protein